MRCEAVLVNSPVGGDEAEGGYDLCERALQRDQTNVRGLVNLSFKFINPVLLGTRPAEIVCPASGRRCRLAAEKVRIGRRGPSAAPPAPQRAVHWA